MKLTLTVTAEDVREAIAAMIRRDYAIELIDRDRLKTDHCEGYTVELDENDFRTT